MSREDRRLAAYHRAANRVAHRHAARRALDTLVIDRLGLPLTEGDEQVILDVFSEVLDTCDDPALVFELLAKMAEDPNGEGLA